MPAVLERERRTYGTQKAELLATHAGQFALVHDDVVGTFTTFNEAYEEGVRRYGLTPFLVQQIRKEEPTAQYPALDVGAIVAR